MRYRLSFFAALLLVLVPAFAAAAANPGRVLTVMDWKLHETQQTQAWFQYVKDRFEADHPGVTVEYVYAPFGPAYNERIITSAVAGAAPDVVSLSVLWARELFENGVLLPLNDLIATTPSLAPSEFIPTTQQYNQKDGTIFGIINAMDSAPLMYELDAFEEAGYDTHPHVLQTWGDFLTAAKKMTRRDGDRVTRYGYGGPVNVELFTSWLVANDANFYNDELTKAGFNTPQALEAAHFVYDLQHVHGVLGGHFRYGEAAMGYGITSHPYFIAEEHPEMRFNMTTYPPGPSGTDRGTITWANMHSITNTSDNVDLAWEFITYYTGLEGNIDIFEFLGYASSPRFDFYQSSTWRLAQSDNIWLPMIPELAMAGGTYPFVRSTQLTSQVWNPLIVQALRGQRSMESAFAEAERLYNLILAE